MRTAQGKLHLFVAIDRVTKFAFVQLHEKVTARIGGNFLRALVAAVPYRIHTVLTDNGIQFTFSREPGSTVDDIKQALAAGELFRAHAFDYACAQLDIEHRLIKPKHPWTNGQVERMNRTIKSSPSRRRGTLR